MTDALTLTTNYFEQYFDILSDVFARIHPDPEQWDPPIPPLSDFRNYAGHKVHKDGRIHYKYKSESYTLIFIEEVFKGGLDEESGEWIEPYSELRSINLMGYSLWPRIEGFRYTPTEEQRARFLEETGNPFPDGLFLFGAYVVDSLNQVVFGGAPVEKMLEIYAKLQEEDNLIGKVSGNSRTDDGVYADLPEDLPFDL